MKPSEIRGDLLREHAQIRVMLDVTLTFAEVSRVDAPGCDDLREHLVRLTDAMRAHNLREEALLGDLIPAIDAWGPARAAIMFEEHVQEHERLYAALLGIPCTPAEFAAAGVAALVGLIGEHMDREEAAFLGEDVLRDDLVVANQSGG
jgi:Hemerythrin HHE cation binding domain